MKPGLLLFCLATVITAPAAEFSCTISSTKGEPVADTVVSLIPLDTPAPPVPATIQVDILQEGQEFTTYVTVVQTGTKVVFPNRDTVQHHVYSLSKPKKFELPLYNPGQAESIVIEVPGLVTIGCNIHDWMITHLVVVPTPWFAQSGPDGMVKLNAPAGRYRLEIWHPRATATAKEVTLAENSAIKETVTLTLKPDRRVRRSLGAKSGGY